jgi:Flp pilus assembly protein TadG
MIPLWTKGIARVKKGLRRFHRSQDGSSTIEFVIMFPVIFTFFLSTFELGMLETRHVMLDRGLDIAVRAIRLGQIEPVTHDAFKQAVCNAAAWPHVQIAWTGTIRVSRCANLPPVCPIS